MAAAAAPFAALPCLLLVLLLPSLGAAANVTYDHRSLIIDGRRRLVISTSIHYPRSVPEVGSCSALPSTPSFYARVRTHCSISSSANFAAPVPADVAQAGGRGQGRRRRLHRDLRLLERP